MVTPSCAMMNENSPIGVPVNPVRNASLSGVPLSASALVTARGLATKVKAAIPPINPAAPQSSYTSICIPIATKKTALKIFFIPSNVRST